MTASRGSTAAPIVRRMERFTELDGWANRILRIELGSGEIWVQETAPYVPEFLAGRGLAARIAWEEYPEPVDPFDARNPLMVFGGALTGSRSPYSGRANISAFSPQCWPHNFFSRSNIGAHFGGEMKRAGYDGVIITGASRHPVRIRIRDDEVSILPADDLWGQNALTALEMLEEADGRGARSLAIGPAGERLSRIATIQTASSSAAGHGGFGAVMGSKRLKAITVQGSGAVALADRERLMTISKALGEEARTIRDVSKWLPRVNAQLAAEGGGRARAYACTEACLSPCNLYYQDVPGVLRPVKLSGHWTCVGGIFRGIRDDEGRISRGNAYDWRLGLRGGLEINVLANQYGLNEWELIIGMVPWLEACQQAGLISEFNGRPMDWQSVEFWAEFLRAIAYREGLGDELAEGGWRAARILGLGEDLVRRYYTGWGYPGHWDGHGSWSNYLVYPYWLVSALQWATDTRDPIPSGHGYTAWVMEWGPFGGRGRINWAQMRAISEQVYGDADATDPLSGYKAKAYPAFFHTRRSVIKDTLPGDDFIFPLIYSPNTEDGLARVLGIKGPSLEHELFVAGTGVDWTEEQFNRAAERVYTLERALQVRHWARDRQLDESVLPSFEYPENWKSPLLDRRYALDRTRFEPVMDDYYRLQGWDTETGWPTEARLRELGLEGYHGPMVEGARAARERVPAAAAELPTEPVPEVELAPLGQ